MNILNLEQVGRAIGARTILKDVTVGINEGDRIGVIGINGAGKSTLLSIVAGETEPDEGQVVTRRRLRISFLPQNPRFDERRSVLQNVIAGIQDRRHTGIRRERHGPRCLASAFRIRISRRRCSPADRRSGRRLRQHCSRPVSSSFWTNRQTIWITRWWSGWRTGSGASPGHCSW